MLLGSDTLAKLLMIEAYYTNAEVVWLFINKVDTKLLFFLNKNNLKNI